MSRDAKVLAPLSDDQIASLNAYQESEYVHPYTCGAVFCHDRDVIGEAFPLAADRDGLHCIGGFGCGYTLTWAYSRTTDWSWRKEERRQQRRERRESRKGLRRLRRHMRLLAR